MKVWVVKAAETLPQITGEGRLMRAGLLAENFARRGHKVTFWMSTFLHTTKEHFVMHDKDYQINQNYRAKMIYTDKTYEKNISIDRILYAKSLSKKMKEKFNDEDVPDFIYCSWPLIELSYECVVYAEQHNIPIVVDIRDMWPDNFVQPFNGIVKKIANSAVYRLYGKQTEYVMQHATKIIGVVPKSLLLAEKYGRKLTNDDHVVYLAFKKDDNDYSNINNGLNYWKTKGITSENFIVLFLGSVTNRIDNMDIIIEAAKMSENDNVKFVVCGTGPDYDRCRDITKNMKNIIFAGWQNPSEMYALTRIASIGLLPYRNSEDFKDSLPNKFAEYLSFGLPVLTSLMGLSKEIVENYKCGRFFSTAIQLNNIISEYIGNSDTILLERKNAIKLYDNQFNADIIYDNFVNEIEHMVNKGEL